MSTVNEGMDEPDPQALGMRVGASKADWQSADNATALTASPSGSSIFSNHLVDSTNSVLNGLSGKLLILSPQPSWESRNRSSSPALQLSTAVSQTM